MEAIEITSTSNGAHLETLEVMGTNDLLTTECNTDTNEMKVEDVEMSVTTSNCQCGEQNNEPPKQTVNEGTEKCFKNDQALLENMYDELVNCPAVFKSQQIGEPELSAVEKRKIAEDLLKSKPISFLYRFGTFLKNEHLALFKSVVEKTPEVEYYIEQLRYSQKFEKSQIKNRRFEALQRMETEGKYFSESEMEVREPLLYHQLVGQYLSEKEKLTRLKPEKDVIPTFSYFLIAQMEKDNLEDLQKKQEKDEEDLKREYNLSDDDDEPSEIPVEAGNSNANQRWGADWDDEENAKKKKQRKIKKTKNAVISNEEKNILLEEFKTHMHMKFLNGMDGDFDYSMVDSNSEYDCITVRTQDEEEKYFDEETCDDNIASTDTGIEDY